MKLSIPKPCHADWNKMTSEERSRFCSLCKQSVHNVADLTETEAHEILSLEDTCARISYNNRGQVRTKNGFSSLIFLTGLLACNDTESVPPSSSTKESVQIESATIDTEETTENLIPVKGKPTIHNQNSASSENTTDNIQNDTQDCEEATNQTNETATTNKNNVPDRPRMGKVKHP